MHGHLRLLYGNLNIHSGLLIRNLLIRNSDVENRFLIRYFQGLGPKPNFFNDVAKMFGLRKFEVETLAFPRIIKKSRGSPKKGVFLSLNRSVSVSSVIICAEVTSRTERGPSITGAVLMLHLLTRRRTLIYRWASRKAPSTPENRLRNIMQTVLGRINLLKRGHHTKAPGQFWVDPICHLVASCAERSIVRRGPAAECKRPMHDHQGSVAIRVCRDRGLKPWMDDVVSIQL